MHRAFHNQSVARGYERVRERNEEERDGTHLEKAGRE